MPTNRRQFFSYAAATAACHTLGLRGFGALRALAQSAPDYKALVCVSMSGGNDANNMLIPFDAKGYRSYSAARGSLALAQGTLLQCGNAPSFAIHPSMPEVRSLFDQKSAAFVANVGTLLAPTTKAQYLSGQSNNPVNLFSHPDQQAEWQNQSSTSLVNTGWAGRIADRLTAEFNPGAAIPMITTVNGDSLFCDGSRTSPFALTSDGPGNPQCSDGFLYCSMRDAAAQRLAHLSSGSSLVRADNQITSNAYGYNSALSQAFQSLAPLQTPRPNNWIGAQLYEVAQIIRVRQALGVRRQIFFVELPGFDTHSSQLDVHAQYLSQISSALGAFSQALEEIGVSKQVTTFTCSEFGRVLQANSSGGSDHGWGGHHIVMGGAVQGGRIYGTFPDLTPGGPDDCGTVGQLIPTTSTTQYAATLAQWFGVSPDDLAYVLPNVNAFSTNNLGFFA